MEIFFAVLLIVVVVYFFADVFILFGIRLVAFSACALVVLFSFNLIAELLIWLGLDGKVAWASIFSALVVGFAGMYAIRCIGLRAALASGTMSATETVSLDSVRTGVVSAFSVLVCQATLLASSGNLLAIPWLAILILVLVMTVLDVLAPQLLHSIAMRIQ